jgi:SSS family solute:Na+ symporter
MNPTVALAIIGVVIVLTTAFGLFGVRKIRMSPQQFIVGGRSFGAVFLWLLMAGEVYTSFTFLGAAGWAYGKGAPAFYIICYLTLGCTIGLFVLPLVWRVARQHNLLTNADYFATCYQSRSLGVLAAVVGVVFLIPYITLQLTGIQILLRIAGYGSIDATVAAGLAFFLVVIFVFFGGLRGAAWASLIKDALVLAAVMFAGILLPIQFFGSPQNAIDQVMKLKPNWMTLVPGGGEFGTIWFVSTILLTGCGAFMWPHAIAATYSAKDEKSLRRNLAGLPFYQIMLLLMYFAGFSALILKPGLKGQEVDQSFMLVVQEHYPAWTLGLVGGAGCLAALIPAATQILAAASLISKNILSTRAVGAGEGNQTLLTRCLIVGVALLAFGLWIFEKATLVGLLLIAYSGITQLFPGVLFSLMRQRPSALSVVLGILVGIGLLVLFAAEGMTVLSGLNVGFVALLANAMTVLLFWRAGSRP